MSISFVQDTNQTSGVTSGSVSFTNTPARYNLLLASVFDESSANQPTVSDTTNGNWTLLNSTIRAGLTGQWLFGVIAAASQPKPVSITANTSDGFFLSIYELLGCYNTIGGVVSTTQTYSSSGVNETTTSAMGTLTTVSGGILIASAGVAGAVTGLSTANNFTYTSNMLQSNVSGGIQLFDGYSLTPTGSVGINQTFSWTTGRHVLSLNTTFFGASAPTVTSGTAGSITTTAATISSSNVTSAGNQTVTDKGVVWATTSNPTTSNNKVSSGSGGTGSYNINLISLPSGTLIHYRAYAVNPVGTSYGSDTTFTTSSSNNGNFFLFM